jgi:hypothetical protein
MVLEIAFDNHLIVRSSTQKITDSEKVASPLLSLLAVMQRLCLLLLLALIADLPMIELPGKI